MSVLPDWDWFCQMRDLEKGWGICNERNRHFVEENNVFNDFKKKNSVFYCQDLQIWRVMLKCQHLSRRVEDLSIDQVSLGEGEHCCQEVDYKFEAVTEWVAAGKWAVQTQIPYLPTSVKNLEILLKTIDPLQLEVVCNNQIFFNLKDSANVESKWAVSSFKLCSYFGIFTITIKICTKIWFWKAEGNNFSETV